MGDPQSVGRARNTERTRRQILDSTRRLLVDHGTGITIALAADAAGVSKSGLLHHFGSREQLLREVLDDTNSRFRADVLSNLDLSENTPGKMLRAYVRTLCSTTNEATSTLGAPGFWAGLHDIEGTDATAGKDAQQWDVDLGADGLDPDLVRIVRRAAEGIAAAFAYDEETEGGVARAAQHLIAMTHLPPPWPTQGGGSPPDATS